MTAEAVRAARTLPTLLDALADSAPGHEFLVYRGERWAYGAFREEAARIAPPGSMRTASAGATMSAC